MTVSIYIFATKVFVRLNLTDLIQNRSIAYDINFTLSILLIKIVKI